VSDKFARVLFGVALACIVVAAILAAATTHVCVDFPTPGTEVAAFVLLGVAVAGIVLGWLFVVPSARMWTTVMGLVVMALSIYPIILVLNRLPSGGCA
jgi:predicted membrane channel-forming protein YqfA (hemolysin III family)